ncbi:MAG: hypothetical protein MHMPM18_004113 [Marteilia pararefringens]
MDLNEILDKLSTINEVNRRDVFDVTKALNKKKVEIKDLHNILEGKQNEITVLNEELRCLCSGEKELIEEENKNSATYESKFNKIDLEESQLDSEIDQNNFLISEYSEKIKSAENTSKQIEFSLVGLENRRVRLEEDLRSSLKQESNIKAKIKRINSELDKERAIRKKKEDESTVYNQKSENLKSNFDREIESLRQTIANKKKESEMLRESNILKSQEIKSSSKNVESAKEKHQIDIKLLEASNNEKIKKKFDLNKMHSDLTGSLKDITMQSQNLNKSIKDMKLKKERLNEDYLKDNLCEKKITISNIFRIKSQMKSLKTSVENWRYLKEELRSKNEECQNANNIKADLERQLIELLECKLEDERFYSNFKKLKEENLDNLTKSVDKIKRFAEERSRLIEEKFLRESRRYSELQLFESKFKFDLSTTTRNNMQLGRVKRRLERDLASLELLCVAVERYCEALNTKRLIFQHSAQVMCNQIVHNLNEGFSRLKSIEK